MDTRNHDAAILEKIIKLRHHGDFQGSLDLCEQNLPCHPGIEGWILDNKARALISLGRRDDALRIWEEITECGDPAQVAVAKETLSTQRLHLESETRIKEVREMLLSGNKPGALLSLRQMLEINDEHVSNICKNFISLYLSELEAAELFSKASSNMPDKRIDRKECRLLNSDAIAACLDVKYFQMSYQMQDLPADESRARIQIAQYIIENIQTLSTVKLSERFDIHAYAHAYGCSPLEAALDLLTDENLEKRPFPEFDTNFVSEYYSEKLNRLGLAHPYLLYLTDSSICINPSAYVSGIYKETGKSQIDSPPDYWNYNRANAHLHGLFDISDEVLISISPRCRFVHVLVPAFDVKSISAGFFGVFAVAKQLAMLASAKQLDIKVNLLFVDSFEFYPSLFSFVLAKTTGLEDLLDLVTFSFLRPSMASKHGVPCQITSNDLFVASVWYTAYIAKNLTALQGSSSKYLYLIQDYEAGFYARSSHYCLAESTYDRRDYFALVSSLPLYRQLFRQGYLPVDSVYFENASASKLLSKPEFMSIHEEKEFKQAILYGRPNVNRNMFELTILSLMMAYRKGVFTDKWRFYSLGLGSTQIELSYSPDGEFAFVEQCPRMTLSDYEKFIQSADLCLTLMASPHPSLLPFDFSGNGTPVVTNTFEAKDKKFFASYSPLIFAERPDPVSLSDAINSAVQVADDLNWRYANKCDKYPRSWCQTWTPSIKSFLHRWISQ